MALEEYAAHWPGDVVALVEHEPVEVRVPTTSMRVVVGSWTDGQLMSELSPDLILALHRPEFGPLNSIAPTVYTAEFTREMRVEQQHLLARGLVDRARMSLGQLRRERVYRDIARQAAGLQCNGHVAWEAYAALNPRPLFFRDHRIRRSDLSAAAVRPIWKGDRPLRVAFSGRMTVMKGPGTVLEVARLLPEVEFVMLGDGELREELRRNAPSNVRFEGFLDFERWKEFMRESVDLALLPHPQGDPSCTYFEALGCGVPVLGVANSTWLRLANDGLGFVERDAEGLANRIRSLQPEELDTVRTHALGVLEPFEDVAAMRAAHMVDVARTAWGRL